MKTFDQFKQWILDEATKKDACDKGKEKAQKANDWQSLLSVVKEYSNWLYMAEIINASTLISVPDEELVRAGIYVNKTGIVQKDGYCIYYNSTSKHYNSSTSEHYNSSTSEHYDSSTSKHYHSSTSEHYNSSTSKHYNSSTSKHYDSSTSEHYHSSTSEHYNSSTSKHYHSSTSKHYHSSTSEHWDSSYAIVYELKDKTIINENAVIRERSTGKLYFKKHIQIEQI